jgi:hypothetical protein
MGRWRIRIPPLALPAGLIQRTIFSRERRFAGESPLADLLLRGRERWLLGQMCLLDGPLFRFRLRLTLLVFHNIS